VKTIYTGIRDALISFKANNAPGLVFDLRVNSGGNDALAAAIAGFFYTETTLYEYQAWYNPESDSLEIWPLLIDHFNPATLRFEANPDYPPGALYTEPQEILFDKPVMVLVSPRNISSGEGIPMMLQRLPLCKVLSFYGTNGSFAMVERLHYLFPPPGDLYVRYPYGVSMNQHFTIQLDSDSTMTGGVIPDIRVPMNDTVLDQLYIDSLDVEVLYAVKMMKAALDVELLPSSDTRVSLDQNSPNPFNRTTMISYHLREAAKVTLWVIDQLGRTVAILVDQPQSPGDFSVPFEATGLAPGVYSYRLSANQTMITRKLILY